MQMSCSKKDWQSMSWLRCPVGLRSLLTSGLSRLTRMAKIRLMSSSSHSSAYIGRPPSCNNQHCRKSEDIMAIDSGDVMEAGQDML